tara:strand:- start:160 stop:663 length:504 start_codon:yes stop_codon:yes gene_type:complete
MIPVFIKIPFTDKFKNILEMPITLQIPTIIVLTILFKRKIVFTAFTIYLFLGLFVVPIFHEGGSLGYLLTPNFGYLIGIYPLIRFIDKLNNKNTISIFDFLRTGILAICFMHITGIIYSLIQILLYKQVNIILYIFGNYSLGKIGYHFLMLIPLAFLVKPIIYIKNR